MENLKGKSFTTSSAAYRAIRHYEEKNGKTSLAVMSVRKENDEKSYKIIQPTVSQSKETTVKEKTVENVESKTEVTVAVKEKKVKSTVEPEVTVAVKEKTIKPTVDTMVENIETTLENKFHEFESKLNIEKTSNDIHLRTGKYRFFPDGKQGPGFYELKKIFRRLLDSDFIPVKDAFIEMTEKMSEKMSGRLI